MRRSIYTLRLTLVQPGVPESFPRRFSGMPRHTTLCPSVEVEAQLRNCIFLAHEKPISVEDYIRNI